jgi:hypothetical protein
MTATCTRCEAMLYYVNQKSVGRSADGSCGRTGCRTYGYRAGCEHLSFLCEGCGDRFCSEHRITLGGLPFCLACVIAELESQEPDCECRQTDVDLFDARGCELHHASSPRSLSVREVADVTRHDALNEDCPF